MTKQEFEKKIGKGINDEHFKVIDYVYQYHPCIKNNNVQGIEQMAELYQGYGMGLIKNMVYLANERRKLDNRIKDLERDLDNCKRELERIKAGDYPVQL